MSGMVIKSFQTSEIVCGFSTNLVLVCIYLGPLIFFYTSKSIS